jgi:hypothetical protein
VLGQLVGLRRPFIRFLFIASQVSPSLPPRHRLPFCGWLQVVVFSLVYLCSVLPTGDSHPTCNAPMMGAPSAATDNLRGFAPAVSEPRRSAKKMKTKLHLSLIAASLLFASCATAPKQLADSPPVALVQKTPAYPIELIKRDIIENAVVEVEFTVTTFGDVIGARVINDCRPEYARLAIPCVLSWKFKPQIKNGIPTSARMRTPVYFTAHEVKNEPNSEGSASAAARSGTPVEQARE